MKMEEIAGLLLTAASKEKDDELRKKFLAAAEVLVDFTAKYRIDNISSVEKLEVEQPWDKQK